MKNISAWAIRHPVTPIVLFVVLFFLGTVAFIRLPINLQPDVAFPEVDVNISEPGAAPTEMETQIAQKVEGSIASIGNIHHQQTYISEGNVLIIIEFNIGTPIDRAVTDIRAHAIARVRADLPQGHSRAAKVQRPGERRWNVCDLCGQHHRHDAGAIELDGRITIHRETPGGREGHFAGAAHRGIGIARFAWNWIPRDSRLWASPPWKSMSNCGQLNLDAPGGRAQVRGRRASDPRSGRREISCRRARRHASLLYRAGKSVRLREIADVHDGVAEMRSLARLNGRPATAFSIV